MGGVNEMADYKTMYLTMFHAAEEALVLLVGCCGDRDRLQKVVNILSAAQQHCENMYVEHDEV